MTAAGRTALRAGVAFFALLSLSALLAMPAAARQLEVPGFLAPGRNPDESPSTIPGGRPYELINVIELNQTPTLEGIAAPPANIRDLSFDLPPGIIANTASFPRCSSEAFASGVCGTVAQAGVAEFELSGGGPKVTVPVFNMAPPPGRPAQFAFRSPQGTVHIDVSLRTGTDYGATATVSGLSENAGIISSAVRIWGVPGDAGHDALRFTGSGASAAGPYPEAPPFKPLISNPTSCSGPLVTTMEATTWQSTAPIFAAPFEAPGINSCNQLEFSPVIEAKPTTNLADSPSGLDFHVELPQIQDPEGSATAQLRTARISLPAGLEVNPAAINGIGTCSEQAIGLTSSSNETQLLRYDLPPVNYSGSFTVSHAGKTTAPILSNATGNQVRAALETLPGFGGNIKVEGAPGGWIVTFTGALAGTEVPLLTGTVSDVPGQTIAVKGESGTFTLTAAGVTTDPLPFNVTPKEIETALREIPSITLDNLYPGNLFVQEAGEEEGAHLFRVLFVGDFVGKTSPAITATSSLVGPEAGVIVTSGDPPPTRALSVAIFGANAPGSSQFSPAPAACPDSSKIGTVRVDSQALIDHPIFGNVYLAAPEQNPFGSLLAFYLTVEDPATGIIVKLPGRIEPDPASGRLVATITEVPQLPFEDLQIELFKGTAAPLRTPSACRNYVVESVLTPWSAPEGSPRRPKDSFTIENGAGGGPCVSDPAALPDGSKFLAGTADPSAGIYSPLNLKLARADGTATLPAIDTTLPPGLLARIAGRSLCADAAIGSAATRSAGAELSSPSCGASSRVGKVNISAGAGPEPFNLTGSAYLAGPYHGAPYSLALITPALAGPFDLGTVVVRVALAPDPHSTRVRATSDPFPTILRGLPIDLRSVALNLDPDFAKNPTSCNPLELTGANPAQTVRFQVGDCKKLTFHPKLALSLKGGTKPKSHPALTATVTNPGSGTTANIAATQLLLPKSLRFDPTHATDGCSATQFAASACSAASVYGQATVETPLLPAPLRGPVYLRRLATGPPQLVVALAGSVNVVLEGALALTKSGAVRVDFEGLPDVPITKLTLAMSGAKKGLLKVRSNLCGASSRATALFDGQSGATFDQQAKIGTGCKGAKKRKSKHARGRSR